MLAFSSFSGTSPLTSTRRCGACVQRRGQVPLRVSAKVSESAPAASSAAPASATRELLALKEWNVTCAALGDGKQTVLFRKGGIAEGPFKTRAKRFLLFPTKFHTEEKLLQPEAAEAYASIMDFAPGEVLDFNVVAEVTGCWSTFDPSVLERTSAFHIWNEKFLDTRLKWRPKTPITVLELRAYRVPALRVPSKKEFFGCFSWVELQDALPSFAFEGLQPVLGDEQFAAKQRALREALRGLEVEELAVE